MEVKLLADLAETMGLTIAETVALPTVVEVAARKVGMSRWNMIREMQSNAALRDYLKTACAEGAKVL